VGDISKATYKCHILYFIGYPEQVNLERQKIDYHARDKERRTGRDS
jgi:hypothetical protein